MLNKKFIKFYIFSLFFFTVLTLDITKNSSCPDNTTKCNISNDLLCCAGTNMICCEDGQNCCPTNTICDIKNKMCITNKADNYGFLQTENNFNRMIPMVNSKISITILDTLQFIDGFLLSTKFYENIDSYEKCKASNVQLGNHLISLIEDIKDHQKFPDTSTAIKMILSDLNNVINDMILDLNQCKNIPNEITQLSNILVNYFHNEKYLNTLVNNLLNNMYFFMALCVKVKSDFERLRYYDAGKDLGLLLSLVIMPEITNYQLSLTYDLFKNNGEITKMRECLENTGIGKINEINDAFSDFSQEKILFVSISVEKCILNK